MNLIGVWGQGFKDSLWIMTNLEPQQAQRIYFHRMKMDRSFRDLKSLLEMTKVMNNQQQIMEKMPALLLPVFAIGLLVGEGLRDHLYGEIIQEQEEAPGQAFIPGSLSAKNGSAIPAYSSCSSRNGSFRLASGRGSSPL